MLADLTEWLEHIRPLTTDSRVEMLQYEQESDLIDDMQSQCGYRDPYELTADQYRTIANDEFFDWNTMEELRCIITSIHLTSIGDFTTSQRTRYWLDMNNRVATGVFGAVYIANLHGLNKLIVKVPLNLDNISAIHEIFVGLY